MHNEELKRTVPFEEKKYIYIFRSYNNIIQTDCAWFDIYSFISDTFTTIILIIISVVRIVKTNKE